MPSTIYWPDGLAVPQKMPAPLREGFGVQQRSPVLRTDFGVTTISRRIYSDAPADITLGFVFSAAQWAYFTGFFAYELEFGTQWFWLPIRAAGVTELHEVNFHGEMPSESLTGVSHVTHQCRLVSRSGLQISAEYYDTLKTYGTEALFGPLQALENFVNG